jgi:hypothetical protein
MGKITKLSLVAILGLAGSLSADTLAEAFAASKIKGEIKAQYFDVQNLVTGNQDDILTTGGNLNITTGSYYGLNAAATMQAAHVVVDPDTTQFDDSMNASGTVMSELYLGYGIANTSIKVGRQYIGTKLVAGSGSRMFKQSFEGVTITNTDIPNTTVVAAYVDKYQHRTSTDGGNLAIIGDEPSFEQAGDGAYTLYVKNNSVDNLTLQAQYLDAKGTTSATDKDVTYIDAEYKAGPVTVSAQMIDSTNGTVDGRLYGAKVSGNVGMVNLTGLYTTTTDDGTVNTGIGSGADGGFTALPVHGGGVTYFANTDTMVAVAATQVAGVTLVGYYGVVKSPDHNNAGGSDQIDAYGGFVQYAFNKQFSAKVMYESASFSDTLEDSNHFRVYTSYKF